MLFESVRQMFWIAESVHTPNRTSQNERSDKIVYTQPHCSYSQGIDERYINSLYVQNGVSCRDSSVPSNGKISFFILTSLLK